VPCRQAKWPRCFWLWVCNNLKCIRTFTFSVCRPQQRHATNLHKKVGEFFYGDTDKQNDKLKKCKIRSTQSKRTCWWNPEDKEHIFRNTPGTKDRRSSACRNTSLISPDISSECTVRTAALQPSAVAGRRRLCSEENLETAHERTRRAKQKPVAGCARETQWGESGSRTTMIHWTERNLQCSQMVNHEEHQHNRSR